MRVGGGRSPAKGNIVGLEVDYEGKETHDPAPSPRTYVSGSYRGLQRWWIMLPSSDRTDEVVPPPNHTYLSNKTHT